MKRFIFVFYFLLLQFSVFAQYFESGNDPASIHWSQINTKYFRIIFPENYIQKAQYLANLLDTTSIACRFDLQSPAVKTDIVLHTHSVISNAMVAWAPRRADFYQQSPQDGIAQEWYKQLAVHELRHIAQLGKMNTGFGKVVHALTGQQGNVGLYGIAVPNWFTEGDAVTNETALSRTGRGRQPLFQAGMRAQLLQKGYYVYDKANFGSYRNYTPNQYELGYFITGHNKVKYGALTWEKPLDAVARRPFLLFPFSNGLKQSTGFGKNNLYKETMFDLYERWKSEYDSIQYTDKVIITKTSNHFTNYRSSRFLSDGSIVAVKTSIDDQTRIVRISDGEEKILFTPGPMLSPNISSGNDFVVWSEYQPDLRWSNRNYSVIKIGNIESGKIIQLTNKTKYFSPSVSPDNQKIACVKTDPEGRNYLVVLSPVTGEETFSYLSDSLFFQIPVWHPDNNNIITTVVGQAGKSIMKINTLTGTASLLIPFGWEDINVTYVSENEIFFGASYTGIQNIFSLNNSGEINQLTSSEFGATDAQIDKNGNLVYSDYCSDGFRLARMTMSQSLQKKIRTEDIVEDKLAEQLSSMSVFLIDNISGMDSAYTVTPYRKIAHLFNLHSWAPMYINSFTGDASMGVSLASQNSLSTLSAVAGYRYDLNEQTGKTTIDFTYSGFFPVIEAGFSHGIRRGTAIMDTVTYHLKWWESDIHTSIGIPLNLSHDQWIRGLKPKISYNFLLKDMFQDVGVSFTKPETHVLTYEVYFYNQSRMSLRDLYPSWGQSIQLIYRHLPFDNNQNEQFLAAVQFYFPGIIRHHGIRLLLAKQIENVQDYPFSNLINPPRGYTNIYKSGDLNLKSDYVFPIAYPDLNIPAFMYLKRIRAKLFGDFSYYTDYSTAQSSVGFEIYTDWHFFNWPAPFNIGLRESFLVEQRKWTPEFLFGIDIGSLY